MKHLFDIIDQTIRGLPIWALVIWHTFIAAIPTMVLILGFIYVILQIGYLLWKWKKEASTN